MTKKLSFINQNTFVICFRLLLSAIIVLIVTLNFNLYKPMWGIIAALFLQLRPETGFVIEKALCLVAGTFIGIVVGCLILFLFIGQPISSFICLVVFLCICSLISAGINHSNFVYGIALGNITAIIVVLYSISNPQDITIVNALNFASARLIEICIGATAACISSFLIMPHSVKKIYQNHSKQLLNFTIKHLISLTNTRPNNFCVNLATRDILESTISIHNDSSASTYEKLATKNNHVLFSNKALSFLRLIKDYYRYIESNNSSEFQSYAKTLNAQLNKISQGDTKSVIKTLRKFSKPTNTPIVIKNIYLALVELLLTYNSLNNFKKSLYELKLNRIKNYYNPIIIATATVRNVVIFLVCAIIWSISGGSLGMLLATAIMTLLSQLFVGIPNAFSLVKKVLIGLLISVPIALIVKFCFIYQFTESFKHLLFFFCLGLSAGVVLLSISKLQMYGLGYCLGFIFVVQPSNQMSFNVTPSLSICLGLIFGGGVFYVVYKLLPNAPNIITQKLALLSLYGDYKKIGKTITTREQFSIKVAKKALCVYKYQLHDNFESSYIVKRLHRLLERSNKKLGDL
ncbi:hypothetical protein FLM55_01010 [Francisella sp. Scap27]|uniref:FUSC family protein n=1 Tax=Francisella sp. Scap27 TaxID=2589986 RepID=UPI0015BEE025|nr:FUSC family protein [Francisella sp. Scap27]QLE78391.1 hypothetical protein FLM55_01010 [Francisella sp. Scap27]